MWYFTVQRIWTGGCIDSLYYKMLQQLLGCYIMGERESNSFVSFCVLLIYHDDKSIYWVQQSPKQPFFPHTVPYPHFFSLKLQSDHSPHVHMILYTFPSFCLQTRIVVWVVAHENNHRFHKSSIGLISQPLPVFTTHWSLSIYASIYLAGGRCYRQMLGSV